MSLFSRKKTTPPPLSVEQIKKITKILIVDDNKPDELLTHFRKEGWIAQYLSDIDAMQNKQLQRSHIICLDIMGVGSSLCLNNGLELAGEIKKIYPEKKIILYSTLSQHDIFNDVVDVVDKRLKKEGTLLPFSSAVRELALKTLSWDDALLHSYNKVMPVIGSTISYEQYKKFINQSLSDGKVDTSKLGKLLKTSADTVDIIIPLIRMALAVGAS